MSGQEARDALGGAVMRWATLLDMVDTSRSVAATDACVLLESFGSQGSQQSEINA